MTPDEVDERRTAAFQGNGSEPGNDGAQAALLTVMLKRDEEELLAALGASQLGETLGVRPADFGRYVRLGRVWMDTHAAELRQTLCGHPKVVGLRSLADTDEAVEVATVADVLLGIYGHVPATIVAVLVVRRGLDRLCGPSAGPGDDHESDG